MPDNRSLILPTDIADLPALTEKPSVEITREAERAKLVALEADLSEMYENLRMAGMAAGILRGRDLLWFKGYGFADVAEKTPVTRDTPFHLASLTKTFASTLLMQLVEQGELDLDTPAATFGIDPVHWGVIFVLGTTIGFVTPPYGLNLFVVSGVMEVPYAQVMANIFKLLIPLMVAWILVALMPWTTMLLHS